MGSRPEEKSTFQEASEAPRLVVGFFAEKYAIQREFSKREQFIGFLQRFGIQQVHALVGCGFESRTTVVYNWLAGQKSLNVECTIVDLLNKSDPSYQDARRFQVKNMESMKKRASKSGWRMTRIATNLYSKRSFPHRPVLSAVKLVLRRFSGDFLVDISSLPRSIALPALKLLWRAAKVKNLLVLYTEDSTVGALEKQARDFRGPSYLPYFRPRASSSLSIWFPILGSDHRPIRAIGSYRHFNDTYPVVGFPSSRPIETDDIVRENNGIIAGRSENVIFASMNNPFHLSMTLNGVIEEVRSSLGPNVQITLSPHGSKPQSVGVLMTAISKGADILYCQPSSYRPREGGIGSTHLYWLKGTPYG